MVGIYKITNEKNEKFYVGSSNNVEHRFYEHRSLLIRNQHPNIKLQRSWNKYGEEQFHFELVEECSLEVLIEREQYYIDTLQPWFNIRKKAESNLGIKIEVSQKRLEANRKNRQKLAVSRAKKCLLYNLDGTFKQVCESTMEAGRICGVKHCQQAVSALKSESSKCKLYLIKPYIVNYPLSIIPYVYKNDRGKKTKLERKLNIK